MEKERAFSTLLMPSLKRGLGGAAVAEADEVDAVEETEPFVALPMMGRSSVRRARIAFKSLLRSLDFFLRKEEGHVEGLQRKALFSKGKR